MRRHLLALCLPLLLAACDQPPTPPPETAAGEAPAAAAAETPPESPATPVAQPDTAPLFGTWAADPGWCRGEGDGFPITISATRFEGRENSCDITELTGNGDGTFTATLACTGEGQSTTERVSMEPIFGPTGEGIRLGYLDRGGDPVLVFRCTGTGDATSPEPAQ